MRSTFAFLLSSSLALPVFGCSGHTGSSGPSAGAGDAALRESNVARVPASSLPSDALPTAVAANNAFAADLYTRLAANAGTDNFVVSPVSAFLALGMAYAGAQGTTALQMAAALQFSANPGTGIADGQNALSAALESRAAMAQQQMGSDAAAPEVALQVVNSVWGEKTFPWSSSFLDVMAASYGSGVYLEDFASNPTEATGAINDWVKTQTNGAIYPLLMPLDPLTRMVLVNAVYLQLPWVSAFFPSDTTQGAFARLDGSTVTAGYMEQVLSVPYADDGQAQIMALGLQGNQQVVITVPHAGVSLATYEAGLTATSPALMVPSNSQAVDLSIPKTDFTTATLSFKAPLQAMGMTQAFEAGSADFTGMCPAPTCSNLFVDDVQQKAMIQMNEEGVEAAASTAVIFRDAAAFLNPVQVTANRPFLVALVDGPTGAVLFLGHVVDPTASM